VAEVQGGDFNSTMVRLKESESPAKNKPSKNFNSTMVRLKDVEGYHFLYGIPIFQFHYGSVKSL